MTAPAFGQIWPRGSGGSGGGGSSGPGTVSPTGPWSGTVSGSLSAFSSDSIYPPGGTLPDTAFGFHYGWDPDMQEIATQIYTMTDHNNWSAETTLGDTGGGIVMYPCMTWPNHDEYTDTGVPLGNISELHYNYGFDPVPIDTTLWNPDQANSVYDWDIILDIWINTGPSGGRQYGTELMVWMNWSKGWDMPYPYAGTPNGTTTIVGTDPANPTTAEPFYWWNLQVPSVGVGGTIALAQQNQAFAGTMDLAPIFEWIIAHGYVSSADLLQTIEWGPEISSTNNVATTFQATASNVATFVHS